MLKILIFDSGVGGLSISQSLSNHIPEAAQILLADNEWFPYGELEESILLDRVSNLLDVAVNKFQPDCIVIACNTVSTVALEKVRSMQNIPVIGVVPAIKPAAASSESKVIGLLATPATVKRSYTADLVADFANDCTLVSVGSTRLVEIAELLLKNKPINENEVLNILKPFIIAGKQQGLDRLVLGCTHFPLLSDVMEMILPDTIQLIDSSMAVARQVKNVLSGLDVEITHSKPPKSFFLTKQSGSTELGASLQKMGFSNAEVM